LSAPGSGDGRQVLRQLRSLRPSVLNLVPQLLQQLVEAAESGQSAPSSLRFIAVGGAPLAGALLERAARCGLPVFQGYGLSEAASVVTLSTPAANRVGTVGRPLPHTRVRIAASGEILVRGATFSGYLGQPPRTASGWLATGDLGHVDDDGYLHVTGRIDHRFVTAHGRNVSPEWPEQVLQSCPGILQALVFGHARPFNVALLVPGEACGARRLERAVASANAALPGYAQVRRYLVADEPFTVANGLLTPTRRPRREVILARYAARLEALYAEHA
jgi:long-subunit acyl-CoA synthetase (AMP-forming)